MCTHLGGNLTAQACRRAAADVRDLPELQGSAFAVAVPVGRA